MTTTTKSAKTQKKPLMKRISIPMPLAMYQAVKAIATELGVSMAAVIRCSIALSMRDAAKQYPELLKRGETEETWRKQWDVYIIPALVKRWTKPTKTKTKK